MKSLLTFIAGAIVGFIVAFYIDILSKPALPSEPKWVYSTPGLIQWEPILDPTFYDTQPVRSLGGYGEPFPSWYQWGGSDPDLDDTQPVKVKQE